MMNEFCKGGGCTAKLGPGILDKVLKMIPKKADPKLLVGFDHSDDAAVYQLTDELAVVQTLDFFPPMVEDPYLFGKIAATNALSDIYAMGGEVKTALNISFGTTVCFTTAPSGARLPFNIAILPSVPNGLSNGRIMSSLFKFHLSR